MKKRTYYFYKEILPNFLFSILFILLFTVLNLNIEITRSIYVLYFSLSYTLIVHLMKYLLNFILMKKIRKISIEDIIYNRGNKILITFILVRIFNFIMAIGIFFLLGLYFKEYIIVNSIYILLIVALLIEISKIVLNKVLKFDKILMLGTDQKEINQEFDKLINEIVQSEENGEKLSKEEKEKRIIEGLEQKLKEMRDSEKKKDED